MQHWQEHRDTRGRRLNNTLDSSDACDLMNHMACECPSCNYINPDGVKFSTCPHCGIIISKYYNRKSQQALNNLKLGNSTNENSFVLFKEIKRSYINITFVVIIVLGIAMKYVISNNASINEANSSKSNLPSRDSQKLFEAVQQGNVNKVKMMLNLGNNPNFIVTDQTPFEIALLSEDTEMAQLLLDKGANITFNQKVGTPTIAQRCVLANLMRSVAFILNSKIHIDDVTITGPSPLLQSIFSGNVKMLDLLKAHNISISMRDKYGSILLLEAAQKKNPRLVYFLVTHGADVNARGQFGYTPLMFGIKNDDIVNILINAGADVNAKSDNKTTPLHCAVSSLNLNSVKLLIEKGADVSAKDDRGATPLKLTTFYHNSTFPEIAILLKHAGATE